MDLGEQAQRQDEQPGFVSGGKNVPVPPHNQSSRSQFHEALGAAPVPASVIRDQQHEAIASPTMTQQLPLLPSSLQQGITEGANNLAKIIWKNLFPWNCVPVSPISITLNKKAMIF